MAACCAPEDDVVNLPLPRREFPGYRKRAGNVGRVHRIFPGYVHHHDVPCLHGPGIIGIMEHGGIEARSHDGGVSRPLAAAFAPLVLHEGRNLAFGDSRFDGAHGGAMRRNRGVRCLANELNLASILKGAQRAQERPHVSKGIRKAETCWPASASPARLPSWKSARRPARSV